MKKTIATLALILTATSATASSWNQYLSTDSFDSANDQKIYSIKSDNKAHFKFPYSGGSTLTIVLNKFQNSEERYMSFMIDKGQFHCSRYNSYDSCDIEYRLDDGPIQTIRMNENRTSVTKKLTNYGAKKVGRKFLTAKKITVRVPFYDTYKRDFTFNISNPYATVNGQ